MIYAVDFDCLSTFFRQMAADPLSNDDNEEEEEEDDENTVKLPPVSASKNNMRQT